MFACIYEHTDRYLDPESRTRRSKSLNASCVSLNSSLGRYPCSLLLTCVCPFLLSRPQLDKIKAKVALSDVVNKKEKKKKSARIIGVPCRPHSHYIHLPPKSQTNRIQTRVAETAHTRIPPQHLVHAHTHTHTSMHAIIIIIHNLTTEVKENKPNRMNTDAH